MYLMTFNDPEIELCAIAPPVVSSDTAPITKYYINFGETDKKREISLFFPKSAEITQDLDSKLIL